jgi:hypothetical protein
MPQRAQAMNVPISSPPYDKDRFTMMSSGVLMSNFIFNSWYMKGYANEGVVVRASGSSMELDVESLSLNVTIEIFKS